MRKTIPAKYFSSALIQSSVKLTVKWAEAKNEIKRPISFTFKFYLRKKYVVNIATTTICKIFYICRYDKIDHKKKLNVTYDKVFN